ncbi:MAG: hypothetical protein ACYTHJ_02840 [Planctomycetota bacterium]|jgi:hypothetical protein
MKNSNAMWITATMSGLAFVALAAGYGCGNLAVFNPAFVNTVNGDVFPVTPGPTAAFVFVRVVNESTELVQFDVTIERAVLEFDDEGNIIVDSDGNPVTRLELVRRRLATTNDSPANESGVLFGCNVSPITRVGLGENLLPNDAAVFVGGGGPAGSPGFGVVAENLNPLSLEAGNYDCGDTVIFQAFESLGTPGGIALSSFVIDGDDASGIYSGPDTFLNYQNLLEAQITEGP